MADTTTEIAAEVTDPATMQAILAALHEDFLALDLGQENEATMRLLAREITAAQRAELDRLVAWRETGAGDQNAERVAAENLERAMEDAAEKLAEKLAECHISDDEDDADEERGEKQNGKRAQQFIEKPERCTVERGAMEPCICCGDDEAYAANLCVMPCEHTYCGKCVSANVTYRVTRFSWIADAFAIEDASTVCRLLYR
jgi:hypothetical protein